ncbi:acyl carrier protein [Corynebacterium striatum]|uniref:acyl carrier protein n=1 Tax=Corynebacterium striatum TaxID=43770 RepID=UPI003B58D3D1
MANDLSAQLQARFNQTPHKEEPAEDTYSEITALITKVTGSAEGLERDAKLADLGVESLERIELAVRAEERFKVRVNEETMLGIETIGQLAEYVDKHLEEQK